jgi:hypothetical protein
VRDVADDFLLIDVEAQRNFGMLQVVMAIARVGFVGAKVQGYGRHCSDRDQRNYRSTKSTRFFAEWNYHFSLLHEDGLNGRRCLLR